MVETRQFYTVGEAVAQVRLAVYGRFMRNFPGMIVAISPGEDEMRINGSDEEEALFRQLLLALCLNTLILLFTLSFICLF